MSTETWTVTNSTLLLDRAPWLRVWEQDVTLLNGSRIAGYLLTEGRDYAMIFALTADGRVPLVRQYKHGIGQAVYELPGGYLDDGEEPLACAQRELLEETGYVCQRWQSFGSLVVDSNRSHDRAHLFLGTGAHRVAAPRLDETESLTCTLHTPAELWAMVHDGEIETLATVAGILRALDRLEANAGQGVKD
ncbi:MAG: NUDIX hydrolase [Chloroflexi bacterium]|nr:NUDIX hydrolase [Chloroflexota bacterium]